MFDTLTSSQRTTADATLADKDAPASFRKALGQALALYDGAVAVRRQHSAALRDARAASTHAVDVEVSALLAGVASGDVPPLASIGSHVRDTAAAVAELEAGRSAVERAARGCVDRVVRGVYVEHRQAVRSWCATVRTSTPWWEAVPAHVEAAWSACGVVWVEYPAEACTAVAGGAAHTLPPRDRLSLSVTTERAWWAWSCYVAGEVAWRDASTVRPTAWWDARQPRPPRPAPESTARPRRLASAVLGRS